MRFSTVISTLLFIQLTAAETNDECSSLISIVKRVEQLTGSKAAKRARGGLRRTESIIDERSSCDQIQNWYTNIHPTYKAVKLSSPSVINATYPLVIKLAGSSEGVTSSTGIILGLSDPGYNVSKSVNIIEVTNDGTRYYMKRVIASLKESEFKSLDNWQGTEKNLIVRVRKSTSNDYSVVELNYDNAVPNDSMTNLIMCGYQGWFAYPGDGAPVDKWRHWFNAEQDPSVDNLTVEMYPSMDEYDDNDLTDLAPLTMRDGSKAKLFSSAKFGVVEKHFQWMREYNLSGVFHIRFMADIDKKRNRDWKTMVLRNVRDAAEEYGRVFSVSYNLAGNALDNTVLDDLKADWIDLIDNEHITSSSSYLHHNGLPVLRIYGIGFKEVNVSDANKMLRLIRWFQYDADPRYRAFLVGGVPSRWRELVDDSRTGAIWQHVYESLDGIHPWHVGRWSSINYGNWYYNNRIAQDAARCAELGILYMPTMWPGFSMHNLRDGGKPYNEIPRLGGKFMWEQAYNYAKDDNITSIWMAQFDEVDEGTAIFKVASTQQDVPREGEWLSLDADGLSLPNDWYLRLAEQAQKMMRGEITLTNAIPIKSV